jgi:hypothetical protein
MVPQESIWQSLPACGHAGTNRPSRTSAYRAKLRRDAGELIEDVSAFLNHSSLAARTGHLRRLEGQQDRP